MTVHPTARPAARALRVGVLLRGHLVEERVFVGHVAVTFGQALRCALSIPGDGIPHEHLLFATDDGQLRLRVTRSMVGQISVGGQLQSELHTGADVGGVWTVPIARGARGKLQIGDATVLFQELAAPPITPRPVLPASIRGTLGDRIDRRLATIIGASVVVHLAIAAYAWIDDVEVDPLLGTSVAQHYRQETMEVTLPDEPVAAPPTTAEPGPGAATPASPVQTPAPIVPRTRIAARAPAVPSVDDAQRFASILTGAEPGPGGPGEMHARQPGVDLGKQLDAVGDRAVVIGNDDAGFRAQPGPRLGTTPGPVIAGDPTQLAHELPKAPETAPGGRIKIRPLPPEGPGTTLTVQMVLDKITGAYMSGLQRCYKNGLVGDSQLSGKISMSFTVTERGGLADTQARGVSAEVDACISSLMAGWHFAIPRDNDGDPTDAGFRLSLALQPS